MSVAFNGTSSTIQLTPKSVGVVGSNYPLTLAGWIRPVATLQNGWAIRLQSDAVDNSTGNPHYLGGLQDTARMRAYSSVGSPVGPSSTNSVTAGTWVPFMVVFVSNTSRKVYLGNGAVVTDATSVVINPAFISKIIIGDGSFKGDLACLGIWQTELTLSDYQAMFGSAGGGTGAGVVPSTIQNAALLDYWSLLTQASTHTGAKAGIVLTATSTTQGSTHPITEGGTAPSISTHPANQTVTAPATATFSVVAGGTGTLTYQWQRQPSGGGGYTDISGAVASSYTTPATTVSGGSANNGDTYRVVVTGDTSPPATSNAATLTVNAPTGPTINTQPSNQAVTQPATATFSVVATTSGGALSYQWQRQPSGGGGYTDISGAVASSYTTPATTVSGGSANNGDTYRCNVTDSNGTTTTSVATLTVGAPVPGLTSSPMKNNTGTLLTSVAFEAYVNHVSTGALVVKKTGLTSHASTGVLTFTDATLTAAQQYAVRWRRTDTGDEGYERLTAA